jgi:hypothetical protein
MLELADLKVDAVVIETPPYSRPLHAQAAGAAGKKEDAYSKLSWQVAPRCRSNSARKHAVAKPR